ncbi:MAG: helix-turn-helix domain-containing protein [Candidatus Thermoplasmatota archaeon]
MMWATLLHVKHPACAWCHEATLGDASVTVHVLAHFPSGHARVWEEAELEGPGWAEKLERIRALASVNSVDVLESSDTRARVRMNIDECPLLHAAAASGVMPRFPFQVNDGVDEWLVITENGQVSSFVEDLRKRGAWVDVVYSREHHPHESLTPRQRQLMEHAIQQGYYEVPRRVTLTTLAQRLHVAKSTLSEALARGEKHVLEDMQGWHTSAGALSPNAFGDTKKPLVGHGPTWEHDGQRALR